MGSSLNKKLHQQVIKNVTDSNVKFSTAYTVDRDEDAYYPDQNFLRIVPEELQKKNYSVLILSCGSNEITNMDTSQNYLNNIQEWKDKVAKSSEKIYNLAERCLDSYPRVSRNATNVEIQGVLHISTREMVPIECTKNFKALSSP